MSNFKIIRRIADDLKIKEIPNERSSQYFARIIYSALSMWIRYSILDEDILDQSTVKVGQSKLHILNRCKIFLNEMIDLYPMTEEWFYLSESTVRPVEIVRDRLYKGGEVVNVGFRTDLALPFFQSCLVDGRTNIIRGICNNKLFKMSGLIQIEENADNDQIYQDASMNLFQFYGIGNMQSIFDINDYLKAVKWTKRNEINVQFFDKFSSMNFSNSWKQVYKLREGDITVYRNPLYKKGNKDYGFIQKNKSSFYTSQISEHLVEQYEVRRFMYALKHGVENPVKAKYKRYDKQQIVELHLLNGLPLIEENLLLLLGWPKENINDKHHLLFDSVTWDFIQILLGNLNIKLEEIR